MTKADNSETLRIGGWIPPYAPGGPEQNTTAGQPGPYGLRGRLSHPGRPAEPSARRARRPLAVLAGATALAVLGYGVVAVVILGSEPARSPEFALAAPPTWSFPPPSAPVSVYPAPPGGTALPSRDIRKVRAGTTTRPAPSSSATPSRTATRTPATPTPGPAFDVGRTVGVGVAGLTGYRLRNRDSVARVEADSSAQGLSGRFVVRQGLADAGCLSFESAEYPGFYLRHRNYLLMVEQSDRTGLYLNDATFCLSAAPGGFALRSVNYPDHHLIHADGLVRLVRSTTSQATVFRALSPI